MKNIIFWAGLFVATFWDEILLASVKPEKTKRQQQFFETGETAQYFIGAIEPEFITLLRKLFIVKKLPKNSPAYKLVNNSANLETVIYIFNKGVKDGFVLFVDYHKKNSYYPEGQVYYQIFFSTGYNYDGGGYFDRTSEERLLFGNSDVTGKIGDEQEMMYTIWNGFIRYKKEFIKQSIEGKNALQFFESEDNIELGYYLLSGVPNIKKILTL